MQLCAVLLGMQALMLGVLLVRLKLYIRHDANRSAHTHVAS